MHDLHAAETVKIPGGSESGRQNRGPSRICVSYGCEFAGIAVPLLLVVVKSDFQGGRSRRVLCTHQLQPAGRRSGKGDYVGCHGTIGAGGNSDALRQRQGDLAAGNCAPGRDTAGNAEFQGAGSKTRSTSTTATAACQCAERTALCTAVSLGLAPGGLRALVVVTEAQAPASPCGACRQALAEFAADLPILLANRRERTVCGLRELLPRAFSGLHLN